MCQEINWHNKEWKPSYHNFSGLPNTENEYEMYRNYF